MENFWNFSHPDRWTNWLAGLAGAVVGLLGGWDPLLNALVLFMIMDYLTGVACAWKGSTLSSNVGFLGILKKGMVFFIVILATQLDALAGQGAVCRSAALMFYLANEGISILENVTCLGVPVPYILRNRITQPPSDEN